MTFPQLAFVFAWLCFSHVCVTVAQVAVLEA